MEHFINPKYKLSLLIKNCSLLVEQCESVEDQQSIPFTLDTGTKATVVIAEPIVKDLEVYKIRRQDIDGTQSSFCWSGPKILAFA